MIPLNDTEPNRYGGFPFVTIGLIAVNMMAYLLELIWTDIDPNFFYKFGSTPAIVMAGTGPTALATVTQMFLHTGLLHLVFNMIPLWAFGRRVEDACGPLRFLLYYLLCGVGADILSTVIRIWVDPNVPGIGASGALFGVMSAYLVLFPEGRIRTVVLILGVPIWPRLRAIWVVLYSFGIQIIPAYLTIVGINEQKINYWAHIGGFLGGLFIHFFLRPEAFARYMSDVGV